MLENLRKTIGYWYFRYTLVTELYMVEKWEKITIHILFVILFLLFGYCNYKIISGNLFNNIPFTFSNVKELKYGEENDEIKL